MILKDLKTRKNTNENLFSKLKNNFFSYDRDLLLKKDTLYKDINRTQRFGVNNIKKNK